MKTVWEYSTHLGIDNDTLPSGVMVHRHAPYEGKQRLTVVSETKPDVPEAKQVNLHVLEEIEPMWYVNEERKTTFRIIKRCHYCQKYYKTDHEPVLGDRYVIRPKFNTARHDSLGVQVIFPNSLKHHECLVTEYRPAEPDEDHVIADLNGRKLKFAVVRPMLPDENFTHHSCVLRQALAKKGSEYYIELYDSKQKGGRFYYYPVLDTDTEYSYAGAVQHAPGTWSFKYDLSQMRKHHSKYQVFRFTHNTKVYAGFFN